MDCREIGQSEGAVGHEDGLAALKGYFGDNDLETAYHKYYVFRQ